MKIASDFELDDDENVSEGGEIHVVHEYTVAAKILRQPDPDLEEAEYYLIEGADKGCGKCAYDLWKFYSDGTFPTRQKNDADYYLRLSSDLGYAPGQVRFGKEQLEKNREMAKNLFENAYSQGNVQSTYGSTYGIRRIRRIRSVPPHRRDTKCGSTGISFPRSERSR